MITAEELARLFHDTYERLTPEFSYETRPASSVPWSEVPENNKRLMVATAEVVITELTDKGADFHLSAPLIPMPSEDEDPR